LTAARGSSKNTAMGRRRHRLCAAATAVVVLGVLAGPPLAAVAAGPPLPIAGPKHAALGSRYTLTGRTGTVSGRPILGVVVLRGRWDDGSWATLAREHTNARGRYRLAIVLRERGTLTLRLLLPGGDVAIGTIRVG